jgi:hypothetical protein
MLGHVIGGGRTPPTIVTKLARDHDRKGIRTLGIITKPDMLHVGSESEEAFVNLAKNEKVVFRLS